MPPKPMRREAAFLFCWTMKAKRAATGADQREVEQGGENDGHDKGPLVRDGAGSLLQRGLTSPGVEWRSPAWPEVVPPAHSAVLLERERAGQQELRSAALRPGTEET